MAVKSKLGTNGNSSVEQVAARFKRFNKFYRVRSYPPLIVAVWATTVSVWLLWTSWPLWMLFSPFEEELFLLQVRAPSPTGDSKLCEELKPSELCVFVRLFFFSILFWGDDKGLVILNSLWNCLAVCWSNNDVFVSCRWVVRTRPRAFEVESTNLFNANSGMGVFWLLVINNYSES